MHRMLEIVLPLLEVFDYGVQLFVMHIITHFVIGKLLAMVRNRVLVALSLLTQCVYRRL
jgi:hypothetical protein